MPQPILIVDVSAVAHRAFHTLGDFSYEGIETGVVYGLLRTVSDLQELYATRRVCFAFDRGYGKRSEISPIYKQNRHREEDEEKREGYRSLSQQIFRLRTKYLPAVGFKNLFWQDDLEADDVIASLCLNLSKGEQAIIVSNDDDLFQLLADDRVWIWSLGKKKPITAKSFRDEYGIDPALWYMVKACSGCPGDNVIGVGGVGTKTAIRFLSGTLKEGTKSYQAIVSQINTWKKNIPLVQLPFVGTRVFEIVDDEVTDNRWDELCQSLGMKTLLGRRR